MTNRTRKPILAALMLAGALALPAGAATQAAGSGGASPEDPALAPPPPAAKATIGPGGMVTPPIGAPPQVVAAITAANNIATKPYRYGGGHASFVDTGYDCSGAISVALNAAGTLKAPLDSGSFASWAQAGKGQWITVYTNPGHAYVVIAGLRFDTGWRDRDIGTKVGTQPGTGPRWGRPRSTKGFIARHPAGL